MKTIKICSVLLLVMLMISPDTNAQDKSPVMASAVAVTPAAATPQDGTIVLKEETAEEEKPFTLTGSIDTYFHSAFGTTNPYMGGASGPSTAFADLPGFGLGMANLVAAYSGERAGFTADLVFGPRGKAAVFASASGQSIINQMFAWYKLSDKVTLNLGQFNTFLGYEVISPTVNFHYSTSYMFSWGPFSHTGLRADFDLGNGMVAKLAIMNPTDLVEFNPINTYTLGGQIGHAGDAGGVWLNVLYGDQDGKFEADDFAYEIDSNGNVVLDENGSPVFATSSGSLFQVDLTTGWSFGEKFYLGLNTSLQSVASGEVFISEGNVGDAGGKASAFAGIAVYPKVTLSETFSIGFRAEYLSVTNGHLGIFTTDADDKGSVMEFTLSGNYKVGGLTFIPEFRIDQTSEDSFLNVDGKATNTMPSLSLAAVYKF